MVYIPTLKSLGAITTVVESDPRYTARINEEIETKDGGRIRANVYLPKSGEGKWPVLMCSSPYGKDVPLFESKTYVRAAEVIPDDHKCDDVRFEGPSPAYWCSNGYAIVYWDHRGSSQSPGYFKAFSDSHFNDFAEMVEWAADQPWSTGKVGLTGISYLGLNQWPTAARQPRGLACIIPWEGMSDYYRDAARHGGIYCNGLNEGWYNKQVTTVQYGSGKRHLTKDGPEAPEGTLTEEQLAENRDDMPALCRGNNFIDDEFYQERFAKEDYSKIQVPLLSAGNWGGINLHLRGNILGWMRAGSKHKFLRIHTGRHDAPYYMAPGLPAQKSFYDCFLKDDDYDGWTSGKQPIVSFAVRRGNPPPGSIEGEKKFQWRDENEWPLGRTRYQKMHLLADKTLGVGESSTEATLSYKGFDGNSIKFETGPAEEEYEICGHPSVKLSMSLSDHAGAAPADMDVFLALRKINAEGKEVLFSASSGAPTPVTFGWVRASHRTLTSRPYPEFKDGELPFPTLSHLRSDAKSVENDQIYDLECELWPTELIVEKGERLVFEVSPKDPEGTGFFACNDPTDRNEKKLGGTNNIHLGADHDNYIVLPIV